MVVVVGIIAWPSSPSFGLCCEIQMGLDFPDRLIACLGCAPARQSARGQPCWQPQPTRGSNLSPATHLPNPALGHRCHPRPCPRAAADKALSSALRGRDGQMSLCLPEGRKAELLRQGTGKLNLPPCFGGEICTNPVLSWHFGAGAVPSRWQSPHSLAQPSLLPPWPPGRCAETAPTRFTQGEQ